MIKRFAKGIFIGVVAGFISYLSVLLGGLAKTVTGSNLLGSIISLSGSIYIAAGLPFVNLIDYLPMYLIFPQGGASGVFGSILLFAVVIWSLLFGFLSASEIWPFSVKSTMEQTK